MELAVGILLCLVAVICLLGGMNILIKGAMHFLPKETPPQLVLDNLVRFMGGIYFSCGFLLVYAAFHVAGIGNISYFLGIIVLFSGLGRFYSRIKVGTAGRYFDIVMLVEILLGLAIIVLSWMK